MKIFYLIFSWQIFALSLLAPSAALAQEQTLAPSAAAREDLDQIDEPEEGDVPSTPPANDQVKRAPANNPLVRMQPIYQQPLATPQGQAPQIPGTETPAVTDESDDTQAEDQPKWVPAKLVKLQALNKVLTKTTEIDAKIGDKVKFGNLEIQVEKCLHTSENDKPDNTALMTISDGSPGEPKKQVFRGWMFSSAPALSALEHPIYDVILISCLDSSDKITSP